MVVCTTKVAKKKKHLLFSRELRILCIGDRVVVDRVI